MAVNVHAVRDYESSSSLTTAIVFRKRERSLSSSTFAKNVMTPMGVRERSSKH